MIVALAGFLAGLQHVVTGPDHLAAVAPLAVQDRRSAWKGGLSWALGHAGGVGLVALAALALREAAPLRIEAISQYSERLVGAVLIGIGFWGFRRASSRRLHTHVHDHGGERHVHIHAHPASDAHLASPGHGDSQATAPPPPHPHTHSHAAMAVGTLHGMAGGTHFLGVLPALALDTTGAISYLAAYGAGTVAAMVSFAWAVGRVTARAGSLGLRWPRFLMLGASTAAVVVGIYWISAGSGPHA